jgi:hypothetical protein
MTSIDSIDAFLRHQGSNAPDSASLRAKQEEMLAEIQHGKHVGTIASDEALGKHHDRGFGSWE